MTNKRAKGVKFLSMNNFLIINGRIKLKKKHYWIHNKKNALRHNEPVKKVITNEGSD